MFVRVKKCSAGVVPSKIIQESPEPLFNSSETSRDWRSFTCRTPDSPTNLSRCLVANITPTRRAPRLANH